MRQAGCGGGCLAVIGAIIGAAAALFGAYLTGLYGLVGSAYAPVEVRWLDARGVALVLSHHLDDDARLLAGSYGIALPKPLTPTTSKDELQACLDAPTASKCVVPPRRARTPRRRAVQLDVTSERLLAAVIGTDRFDDFVGAIDTFNSAAKGLPTLATVATVRGLVSDLLSASVALRPLIMSKNASDLGTVDLSLRSS